jgi:hypothetical protein
VQERLKEFACSLKKAGEFHSDAVQSKAPIGALLGILKEERAEKTLGFHKVRYRPPEMSHLKELR